MLSRHKTCKNGSLSFLLHSSSTTVDSHDTLLSSRFLLPQQQQLQVLFSRSLPPPTNGCNCFLLALSFCSLTTVALFLRSLPQRHWWQLFTTKTNNCLFHALLLSATMRDCKLFPFHITLIAKVEKASTALVSCSLSKTNASCKRSLLGLHFHNSQVPQLSSSCSSFLQQQAKAQTLVSLFQSCSARWVCLGQLTFLKDFVGCAFHTGTRFDCASQNLVPARCNRQIHTAVSGSVCLCFFVACGQGLPTATFLASQRKWRERRLCRIQVLLWRVRVTSVCTLVLLVLLTEIKSKPPQIRSSPQTVQISLSDWSLETNASF